MPLLMHYDMSDDRNDRLLAGDDFLLIQITGTPLTSNVVLALSTVRAGVPEGGQA
jgi:hypothetical protein